MLQVLSNMVSGEAISIELVTSANDGIPIQLERPAIDPSSGAACLIDAGRTSDVTA
jgi:hypothetical protein